MKDIKRERDRKGERRGGEREKGDREIKKRKEGIDFGRGNYIFVSAHLHRANRI